MSQIPIFRETCPAAGQSSGFRQFSHPTGWLGWWIGQLMAVTNRSQSEWVLKSIAVQPDDYILEVGFGAGTDIRRVSALAIHGFVAGIDRSAVMVRQAKQRNAASIALSVLFAGPGRSWKVVLLPSTIALGATISTIAIWGKSNYRRHDFLLPSENLAELKQRIENLEEIVASSNIPVEYRSTQFDGTIPDRS